MAPCLFSMAQRKKQARLKDEAGLERDANIAMPAG